MGYLDNAGLAHLWGKTKDLLGRHVLTADRTVYVSSDGNDETGDGTMDRPWATIQKAVDEAPEAIGMYGYTISIAPGTYDGFTVVGKRITLFGSTLSNYILTSDIEVQDSGELYLKLPVTLQSARIRLQYNASVHSSSGIGTYGGANGIAATHGSRFIGGALNINNCTSSAILASFGSFVSASSISGANNARNFNINSGMLVYSSCSLEAATNPDAITNGGIITNDLLTSSRQINGKALTDDITLTAADVGALPLAGGTMTGDIQINGGKIGSEWDNSFKHIIIEHEDGGRIQLGQGAETIGVEIAGPNVVVGNTSDTGWLVVGGDGAAIVRYKSNLALFGDITVGASELGIDMPSTITVPDPTSAEHAANKYYVDTAVANVTTTVAKKEGLIKSVSAKTTLADADTIPLTDSAASNTTKKITWANLIAAVKAKLSGVYAAATHTHTKGQITDFPASLTPTAHKDSHKTGGSDPLTAADVGAPTLEQAVMLKRVEIALPSSTFWNSVTNGNGKFVAVAGSSDKAVYSTDGIIWVETTMPSPYLWQSVTYGNGKFVAVAQDSDKAAYSTDGITWTAATLPSSASWSSVTYGNGKFVAVADGTEAAYSTDGINWTAATLPSSASWCSVTNGNGKFVAVAGGSDKAAYSTDGITWTAATLPSSASWSSVTYGNGKFVGVAGSSRKAAYSTDGITWTAATLPSSAYWYSVTYGNGKFVAVTSSSTAAYSTDGITWTAATLPSSAHWYSVTYGNGKFVAVAGSRSDKAAYSTDGFNWTNTRPIYVDASDQEVGVASTGYVDMAVAASKSIQVSVTLAAAEWYGNNQDITVPGVTQNNVIIPSPGPASWEAAGKSGIRCTEQISGLLRFTCSTMPTEDLTYNVLILEAR